MRDPWVALKHLKSVALANDELDDLLENVLYRLPLELPAPTTLEGWDALAGLLMCHDEDDSVDAMRVRVRLHDMLAAAQPAEPAAA
jgi:hypothetical protein